MLVKIFCVLFVAYQSVSALPTKCDLENSEIYCHGEHNVFANHAEKNFSSSFKLNMPNELEVAQIGKLIFRKLFITNLTDFGNIFVPGLTGINQFIIENSRIQEWSRDLFKKLTSLDKLIIIESLIDELNLNGLDLNKLKSVYFRSVQFVGKRSNLGVFKQLTKLERLELANFTLNEMDVIETLTESVKTLVLDDNAFLFNEKPYFSTLSGLNKLVIRHNRFLNDSLGSVLLTGLGSLEHLDLSSNQIGFINELTFRPLIKLTHLKLNSNKLKTINWNIISHSQFLDRLELKSNLIEAVEEVHLKENVTSLRRLDVSFNQLTRVDKIMFSQLTNLTELNLKHNLIDKVQKNAFDDMNYLANLNIDRQMGGQIKQLKFYRSVECSSTTSTTYSATNTTIQ